MSKVSALVAVCATAAVLSTSPVRVSNASPADSGASQPLPGSSAITAGSFIAAIKDEEASIVRAKPRCEGSSVLRGTLVMETPQRAGFPFSATTFSSPNGTFTTVTTTGEESPAVIDEVGRTLNTRATNYVKRLLRSCSL